MRFIGIDMAIASNGIVILKNNGDFYSSFLIKSAPRAGVGDLARFDQIIYDLIMAIGPTQGDHIVFENYAFSRGKATNNLTRQAELRGQFKRELVYHHKLTAEQLYQCSPTTLKKFVTGKAQGIKKELILKEVYRKWDYDTDSADKADAFGLAKLLYYAVQVDSRDMLKYEKEAVDSFHKQNGT